MVNATGRAARKATAAPATAPPAEEPKPERHVRTPLERAQAVYDKAKLAADKIAARLTVAEAEVNSLREEAAEAKVTLDWAATHPLLVKARKEAGETPTDEQRQAGESIAADSAAPRVDVVENFADGSEIVSTVPAGEGEDDSDADETDGDGDSSAPPFDFAAALGAGADPFAGAASSAGPQTTRV